MSLSTERRGGTNVCTIVEVDSVVFLKNRPFGVGDLSSHQISDYSRNARFDLNLLDTRRSLCGGGVCVCGLVVYSSMFGAAVCPAAAFVRGCKLCELKEKKQPFEVLHGNMAAA